MPLRKPILPAPVLTDCYSQEDYNIVVGMLGPTCLICPNARLKLYTKLVRERRDLLLEQIHGLPTDERLCMNKDNVRVLNYMIANFIRQQKEYYRYVYSHLLKIDLDDSIWVDQKEDHLFRGTTLDRMKIRMNASCDKISFVKNMGPLCDEGFYYFAAKRDQQEAYMYANGGYHGDDPHEFPVVMVVEDTAEVSYNTKLAEYSHRMVPIELLKGERIQLYRTKEVDELEINWEKMI